MKESESEASLLCDETMADVVTYEKPMKDVHCPVVEKLFDNLRLLSIGYPSTVFLKDSEEVVKVSFVSSYHYKKTEYYLVNEVLKDVPSVLKFNSAIFSTIESLTLFYLKRYPYTLRSYVTVHHSLATIQSLLGQLLRSLSDCHVRGVIHGDVKPDNILVCEKGLLFLNDFELAVQVHPPSSHAVARRQTLEHPFCTLQYRPPELLDKISPLFSSALDVWSVGCIFYEMVTGKLFQPGQSHSEVKSLLSKELEQWSAKKPQSSESKHILPVANLPTILNHDRSPPKNLMTPKLQVFLERMLVLTDRNHQKSISALHLLRRLLDPDLNTRISAALACIHPFFNKDK
jgi:serine/threonine protein kinase